MGALHRVRRMSLTMVVPLIALVVACGGESDDSASASTPRASEASAATETSAPVVVAESSATKVAIEADATLSQTVEARFDPPFTLQIPGDWTAVLRDRWAFQVFAGNEEFEITFDHTYQEKESVDEAIARLMDTVVRPGSRAQRTVM